MDSDETQDAVNVLPPEIGSNAFGSTGYDEAGGEANNNTSVPLPAAEGELASPLERPPSE